MSKPDPSTALAVASPMPSGLMALEPRNISEGMQLAAVAAKTKLFGVTSPDDAFVRMATGMGLGLSAWQSLRGLFVISGKVGLAADLMLALCISSPDCEYFRCTETTAERATFKARRRGQEEMTLSFTMAEAKTAGLTGNSMYAKYPANMLRARAIAFLARLMFPERMHGILTREEIDGIEAERAQSQGDSAGIVVQAEPEPPRAARPSPPPVSPLVLAARKRWWDPDDGGDGETRRILFSSPDPKDRAMVFKWRAGGAESEDDLAPLMQDMTAEKDEDLRAYMGEYLAEARSSLAGKPSDTAGAA